MSTFLTIRRTGMLTGAGLGSDAQLKIPSGFVGLEMYRNPQISVSDWSVIRDMNVAAEGNTDPSSHGVMVRAHGVTFDKVFVQGFGGDGFRMDAGVGVPQSGDETNANACRFIGCVALACKGVGFHANEGGDINAGVFVGCEAISCEGGDFVDDSFLGNAYVGCGSHSEVGPLKVRAFGGANHSSFVGCYFEGGEHVGIGHPAMAVGGNLAARALGNPDNHGQVLSGLGNRNSYSTVYRWTHPDWQPNTAYSVGDRVMPPLAMRIQGGYQVTGARQWRVQSASGAQLSGATPPDFTQTSLFGTVNTLTDGDVVWIEDGPAASALDYSAYVDLPTAGFAFALAKTSKGHAAQGFLWSDAVSSARPNWWAWTHSDSANAWTYAVSTADNAEPHHYTGRGVFWARVLKVGTPTAGEIFQDTGAAPPTSGIWRKGDLRWNSDPEPGGWSGWRCVDSGEPGTWKGFGAIEG